jgi:hypothetical protein
MSMRFRPQIQGLPRSGARDAARHPSVRRSDRRCEWVALREIVPAATAQVVLAAGAGAHSGRPVTLTTVLPLAWPAMVRADGGIFLGLQVNARSGDVSRDLAVALLEALDAVPGTAVTPTGLPDAGPRLQDLLADQALEVMVRDGFDYWVEGVPDPDGAVSGSLEKANASIVPTVRLDGVEAAYWCRIHDNRHLRWVLPEEEGPLLDAFARLQRAGSLGLGAGTKYVGAFRAHGLLVPVWDLGPEIEAADLVAPATAFRARLDETLADPSPLDADTRRTRAGLIGRQLTLR